MDTRLFQTDCQVRNPAGTYQVVTSIPANTSTTVLLRGWGFLPSETVNLTGAAAILGSQTSAIASAQGDWQLTVAITAAPGTYTVLAQGQTSGYTSPVRTVYVGSASAAPNQWLRGQSPTVAISALGFASGERVTLTGGPLHHFPLPAHSAGPAHPPPPP